MGEDERFLIDPAPTRGFFMGITIPILGIEVTQAIQDLKNSVTLIANKTTFVRVYLDQSWIDATSPFAVPILISGQLAWRRGDDAQGMVSATVNLRPANPPALSTQRENLDLSLNFRLPAEAMIAGPLTLRLFSLFDETTGSGHLSFTGPSSVTVEFTRTPPLIVRVVGLRYVSTTGASVEPDAIHFAYLRSFLERAYPVAHVSWSQIVVAAEFGTPFDTPAGTFTAKEEAIVQLAKIRNTEVSPKQDPESGIFDLGLDPRTHYYGLVSDNGGPDFMKGWGNTPEQPWPGALATGPAGVRNANFAWDKDGSYTDWYGAHEIAHTFGRKHPGFPRGKQNVSDTAFPYVEGQIGDDNNNFVGFDVGDVTLNLPMKALPGKIHHDVMTYADNQWLSAYTYKAIQERLLAEERLFAEEAMRL